MRSVGGIRLIPVVLIAVACLLGLKMSGIWFEGGYTLGSRLSRGETITVTTVPASPATKLRSPSEPLVTASARSQGGRSWAQEMFNYPDVTGSVAKAPEEPRETVIITGSVGAAKEPAKPQAGKDGDKPGKDADKSAAKDADKKSPGKDADKDPAKGKPEAKEFKAGSGGPGKPPVDVAAKPELRAPSSAERAILERLLERRQELDARAREIELRETMLKAAEKKLEEKLAAIKEKQSGPQNGRDEAEAARFKGLITMYEAMKPKEAAKIFDRLDLKILAEVAGQINPRRMSEILAQMSPEAAQKLTVEFASRDSDRTQKPADLPKIEGRPNGG
jgi:flagellar motility protein MotE (MotC chaperone)